jgi:tRNA-dihydrouridine synthase C
MDGVTDFVYRDLLTSMFGGRSGISLCTCEFVRVTRQPVQRHVFLRHCPELETEGRTAAGVPVFVQLLGGDPDWMAENAQRAVEFGAPGIDLNFGCPAKTVNNSDGGAVLLKEPGRVEAVTRAVRNAVPAHVPVSVKVRVGWDSAEHVTDIAHAAQDGGGSWLTVHARTRTQGYKPPVDWEAIARARASIAIPVVANGDVFDAHSLQACSTVSNSNAFMIGRGAMGHPDAFARLRGWRTEPLTGTQMRTLLLDYVARMLAADQTEGRALNRTKQWLRMGSSFRDDLAALFEQVKRRQTLTEALDLLDRSSAAA